MFPPHRGPPVAEQPGGDQLAGPRQADPLGGGQDCRQGEPEPQNQKSVDFVLSENHYYSLLFEVIV